MPRILVGCDHRGVPVCDQIISWCSENGFETEHMGPKNTDSVDYPDYAFRVGERVADSNGAEVGVLVCGWGNGMVIAANKVKGVRAALCMNRVQAEYARRHNDANVLVFSAESTGWGLMQEILEAFLRVEFEGERHKIRVDKITDYES